MDQATREIDIQKEQYRYDAFISYAHEDKPTVAWLHKLLTTFWVPGKRRRRIFMDQESLPAGGGLSNKLKDALRESRFLVVCCSRDSAESYWVNVEISEFLKTHSPDSILACRVGLRADEKSAVPSAVGIVEEQLGDELFLPDLSAYPERLKGQEMKIATKEAFSLLAPLVGLPSKDALLDRRKKNLIVISVLVLDVAISAFG